MLDIRGINPCSRIPKSRHRTLENLKSKIYDFVKNRKEYKTSGGLRRRESGVSVGKFFNIIMI